MEGEEDEGGEKRFNIKLNKHLYLSHQQKKRFIVVPLIFF